MENSPALDECARELQRFANFSRKQGVGLSLFNCSKGVLETPSLPGSAGEKAWSLFPVTNRKRGSIQPSSRFSNSVLPPGDLQSLQDCFSPQSLSWPYKDLLPANISKRTEFYFACITCPTARKRDDCTPIELWKNFQLATRFTRCLMRKLFTGHLQWQSR